MNTMLQTSLKHAVASIGSFLCLSYASGDGISEIDARAYQEAGIDIRMALEAQRAHSTDHRENAITMWVNPEAEPGGDGSKTKPFDRVESAQLMIRQMNQADLYPAGGVTVKLAGGVYDRADTWTLNGNDSGRWNAPVIYRAEADHDVIFHGGHRFRLSQFEPVRDPAILDRLPAASRESVVQLDLGALGISDFGELPLFGHSMHYVGLATKWSSGGQAPELFFDGTPMTLARWPNDDFAQVGQIVERGDVIRGWHGTAETNRRFVPEEDRNDPPIPFAFRFDDKERLQRWSQESDLRLFGYWGNNWSDQTVEVAKVDPEAGIIHSRQPSAYPIQANQRFYAYNALSELEQPGEWYLDRQSGILYLYPLEAEGDARIDLSLLEEPLLRTDSTSYVRFEGLVFMATRANGVMIEGGQNVVMDRCRVGNVGNNGVQMAGRHHRFINGEILGTGGNGISLSGGDTEVLAPAGNEVVNSHIHHFGRIYKTYRPGVRLQGVGHRVAHCEINAAPHVGILISGNYHLIELNYIHDVARETDDMAAIYGYRSWVSHGTVIRHNLFHNITGFPDGTHRASAIYLDGAFSGVSVLNNIFLDVRQGIFFNGGRENRAEGNLFIDVEHMMRLTDMTRAFQTWAVSGLPNLKEGLENSPYRTPVWEAHFPQLVRTLEEEPTRPMYTVVKNNLRYNSPMVIGTTGLREDAIEVSWVDNNPEIKERPGAFDPKTRRFVPNENSGLFEMMPDLRSIPYSIIGRY